MRLWKDSQSSSPWAKVLFEPMYTEDNDGIPFKGANDVITVGYNTLNIGTELNYGADNPCQIGWEDNGRRLRHTRASQEQSYSKNYTTWPDPLGRSKYFDRGDVLPWDWQNHPHPDGSNFGFALSARNEFLSGWRPTLRSMASSRSLAPTPPRATRPGDPIPDFRIARYFKTGSKAIYLELEGNPSSPYATVRVLQRHPDRLPGSRLQRLVHSVGAGSESRKERRRRPGLRVPPALLDRADRWRGKLRRRQFHSGQPDQHREGEGSSHLRRRLRQRRRRRPAQRDGNCRRHRRGNLFLDANINQDCERWTYTVTHPDGSEEVKNLCPGPIQANSRKALTNALLNLVQATEATPACLRVGRDSDRSVRGSGLDRSLELSSGRRSVELACFDQPLHPPTAAVHRKRWPLVSRYPRRSQGRTALRTPAFGELLCLERRRHHDGTSFRRSSRSSTPTVRHPFRNELTDTDPDYRQSLSNSRNSRRVLYSLENQNQRVRCGGAVT